MYVCVLSGRENFSEVMDLARCQPRMRRGDPDTCRSMVRRMRSLRCAHLKGGLASASSAPAPSLPASGLGGPDASTPSESSSMPATHSIGGSALPATRRIALRNMIGDATAHWCFLDVMIPSSFSFMICTAHTPHRHREVSGKSLREEGNPRRKRISG